MGSEKRTRVNPARAAASTRSWRSNGLGTPLAEKFLGRYLVMETVPFVFPRASNSYITWSTHKGPGKIPVFYAELAR
jgi:hypothetical protein